jgi:hypothetical protein
MKNLTLEKVWWIFVAVMAWAVGFATGAAVEHFSPGRLAWLY